MNNGIEKITGRILEDARQEAQGIIDDAQIKADEIKKNKAKEGHALKDRLLVKAREAADERKRRMISAATLELKQKELAVKQQMIDKSFAAVLDKISNMPQAEYEKLISELLLSYPLEGDEDIVSPANGGRVLNQQFINRLNEQLRAAGKKGELKLSSDSGEFKTGFIIKFKGMEINNSFESILRMVRDEIEPEVAALLFSEE